MTSNHPFVDGNKRIGAAVAEIFIVLNGGQIACDNDAIVELFFAIAAGAVTRDQVEERFAAWIVPTA